MPAKSRNFHYLCSRQPLTTRYEKIHTHPAPAARRTLFAQQTVRNDIFAYLKHEGYAPALDKDSDIEFKIQGILYNIIVKQIENEDYAYVEVLANFGTVTPYDKLMEIANDINQNKFVCKCSVSRNENRNVFTLAMEFVTNSRANTEYQISHALRLLPAWVKEFNDRVDE